MSKRKQRLQKQISLNEYCETPLCEEDTVLDAWGLLVNKGVEIQLSLSFRFNGINAALKIFWLDFFFILWARLLLNNLENGKGEIKRKTTVKIKAIIVKLLENGEEKLKKPQNSKCGTSHKD